MFARHSIKHSSQKGSTSSSLQKIVVDLDEQQEESISGGLTLTSGQLFINKNLTIEAGNAGQIGNAGQ